MTVLYSLALLVSAALLFLLEPMVGKLMLPLLGSSPEVWTTTVLFFQAVLLAGYAFAHVTSRLPARRQALMQLAVLAVAALVLPVAVPDASPPTVASPVPWLLGLLAGTAGLPFFALAATGPMLQRWLASTRHKAARDPYFLFAASNGGSLLGLLAYPLIVEPRLSLEAQGRAWAAGYAVAAFLVAASATALWRHGRAEPAAAPSADAEGISWRRRLTWLALAAVPSSLMLGVTTYFTRDVTPVPLLWVLPLALYLVTFVVAFSPWTNPAGVAELGRRVLPLAAVLVTYTLVIRSQGPLAVLVVLHLVALAAAGLLCHGRLAADRPAPRRLTEFYLWIALGGALGGVFNALVAPLVFPALVEYPLAIVAACLLRPAQPKRRPELLEFFLRSERPTRWMDAGVPILLGLAVALALVLQHDPSGGVSFDTRSVVAGVACGLALNLARRPVRFALALGAIFVAVSLAGTEGERSLDRDRSFFGIYRVLASDDGRRHELLSGSTLHGAERIEPGAPEPISYYSRPGPAGQAFAQLPAVAIRRGVAAIGLGAGSLACHVPAGTPFTFYEIDPVVVRIARDPRLFTFLSGCPSRPAVVVGDGRRSLAGESAGKFGLVVVDAFNSDAIPLHLLTREAVQLYLSRTAEGGSVLFHLSNRYLDIEPVLGNIAQSLGLVCRTREHSPTAAQLDLGYDPSQWAVLTRGTADLGRLGHEGGAWRPCADDPGARVWTDDYSNPLSVVHWG